LKDFQHHQLAGREGLYAIWHLGVRPQWLRVGAASDLGGAFFGLRQATWVASHEGNAGIYLAWAFPPSGQALGMAKLLAERLKPTFQSEPFSPDQTLDPTTPAIDCPLPPGTST